MSNLAYWQMMVAKESVDDYAIEILEDWQSDTESFGDSMAIMVQKVNTARESRKRLVCLINDYRDALETVILMATGYKRILDKHGIEITNQELMGGE